jgi:ketosteroid isomerase-like protein
MSRENVERYYRVLEAWNLGDVDGLVGLMSDHVEILTALAGIEGSYRGHDGVRRWWQDFHDVFPDWHAEALTIRALGHATVAHLRLTGHGDGSGAPVDQTMWHVVRWRRGKAVRISRHDDEPEAIQAAGMSE